MHVTWTVLRTDAPTDAVPWRPEGATWWQAGRSSAGRAEPPSTDGRWWSVLATWSEPEPAVRAPAAQGGVECWHVVLEAASFRGNAVLAGGARPFAGLPAAGRVDGAWASVTLAALGDDDAREREFFRRFMHLGRDVGKADGHLASMVQAPDDGAVLTFSVWRDQAPALEWAYAQPQHAGAVARQHAHQLLAATGYLRCAVLGSSGSLCGRPDPLAGRTGRVVRQGLS